MCPADRRPGDWEACEAVTKGGQTGGFEIKMRREKVRADARGWAGSSCCPLRGAFGSVEVLHTPVQWRISGPTLMREEEWDSASWRGREGRGDGLVGFPVLLSAPVPAR